MAVLHAINLSAGWARDGERHARRFQWVRPLAAGESLVLLLTLDAVAVVTLNGDRLADVPAGEHEFPLPAVAGRYELVVETAGEVAAARLEVRGG